MTKALSAALDAVGQQRPVLIVIEYSRSLDEYRVINPANLRGGDYYTPDRADAEGTARLEYGKDVRFKHKRVI